MTPTEMVKLQRELTREWHASEPGPMGPGLEGLVRDNHLQNFLLWHEEDIARRDDLGAERVRIAKRAIDRYNQRRNDCIEQLDRHWIGELDPPPEGVPCNSETPGMIIDRLSILALKEYHMQEEAQREDAGREHAAACAAKLATLRRQLADLTRALDELFEAVRGRTRSFRVYYQFKMYNDPALNPELRRSAADTAPGRRRQ